MQSVSYLFNPAIVFNYIRPLMKRIVFILAAFFACVYDISAQRMQVKQHNLTSFIKQTQSLSTVLAENSSEQARQHPEYGINPYNTQCTDCIELIDKRTLFGRYYINPSKPNRNFSQQSYFPLHYKKQGDDRLHTIHPLLTSTSSPGIYAAENQPVPTKLNLNSHSTSVTDRGFEFEFNSKLKMYYSDESSFMTSPEAASYTIQTVGSEGTRVTNAWPGVNMEQLFGVGEVKTNFVIPAPISVPVATGWMVIEDEFNLPEGYTISEDKEVHYLSSGFYQGDYIIRDEKGEARIKIEKPVYVDAIAMGEHGSYRLLRNGNTYTLKTMVPVSWLTRKENVYPITIDPTVSGFTKIGDFTNQGLSAQMGFTTLALGACDYHMDVTVPGKSELKAALVDLEYTLTYDNTCGTPPLPPPFCTFSQVTMEVVNDTCGTTTGLLACNPAQPPFTGTCTTNPLLVPGASAVNVTGFVPNYLACYQPQCPNYNIPFTLLNRDSICGDVCGYLCARGNMWQTTIEACRVEGSITQDKTQVCAGEAVTFTATPDCGVPPYTYLWTQDGGNSYDTVFNAVNFVVNPQADIIMGCVIVDFCGEFWQTNDLNVTVVPSPPANAGPDVYVCEGGTAQIGGNPSTSAGAGVQWIGENGVAQGMLSNSTVPNPVVTVPAGVVDTITFVLRTQDFTCFRYDTVNVISQAKPNAIIDSSGITTFCPGQTVTLSVVGNYASYVWNTGSTQSSVTTGQPGSYFAVVTDIAGCRDTTNAISVSNISIPDVVVSPDTVITYGDSVTLSTNLNLNAASIDSFIWNPIPFASCTNCTNPVVTPQNEFEYYGITVYSQGCVVSDSALIRVILPNNFFIPNVFTPNGDGANDLFYVLAQPGVRIITFKIFNRAGEKVHDALAPWDGSYKGKPAQPGVYVYFVQLGLFGDDTAITRKGSVTMIR